MARDNKTELPTFTRKNLNVPTRDEMQNALWSAIDAIVFKVRYLSDGDLTCVRQDQGGLTKNAFHIGMAFRAGAHLAAMYDALDTEKPAADGEEARS